MPPNDAPASGFPPSDWFTTTHWSVVLAAGSSESPTAKEALEQLCETYWYPLYVFVRRLGYSPEDAQDSTQAFFERVLERNYFGQADCDKGRFRAFLLAALKHFLSDQRDRARAAKRGGGHTILSLDAESAEERYRLEPVDSVTPDKLYERRWAYTLLERARTRLREEHASSGKRDLYEQLTALEAAGKTGLTYSEVSERLGLTESGVKAAVRRFRQRYGALLRAEIAQTVATAAEIEEEIRYLMAVIGG